MNAALNWTIFSTITPRTDEMTPTKPIKPAAHRCDNCARYLRISRHLGFCKMLEDSVAADWCCLRWKPRPTLAPAPPRV
jgi:hypothetical protein